MKTQASRPDSWQDILKFINNCPVCKAHYHKDNAQLFAQIETATLVHITCGSCQSFFVVMVVKLGHGISSVGMVTDLSFSDLRRLYESDPISLDETIEGYQFINSNQFINSLI